MDTCSQCSTELTRDSLFCPRCGKPVPGAEQDDLLASSASDPTGLLDRLRAATTGEFKIIRELGRGGMGRVYLAQEIKLDRRVALKVLPPALSEHAEIVQRFQREARTAGKLNHPNIVAVFQVSEREGLHFFTMPFVAGPSLRQILRKTPQLDIERCRRYLSEAADALAYAHERDVIHRDIKPENMLLEGSRDGRLLLTDFGIAKALGSATTLTRPGDMMGTPYFMSPEQCGGVDKIDGRADQYSLGLVTYEMLAGRFPFTAETLAGIVYKHLHEYPEPLESVRPDVPDDLRAVIERAIRKDPDERFPDMGAMLRALGSAPSRGSRPPPTRASPRAAAQPRRGRWVALAAVLALAAAGGALALQQGEADSLDGEPTLAEITVPAAAQDEEPGGGEGAPDSGPDGAEGVAAADDRDAGEVGSRPGGPATPPGTVPRPTADRDVDPRAEDRAQAEEARRQARGSRAAALAAGADSILPRAFSETDSLLAGGERDLRRDRLISAAVAFTSASQDFERLAGEARRRRQELEEAAADDSLAAPAEADSEPAASLSPREAVDGLLDIYRQALEAADLSRLKRDVYQGAVPYDDSRLYDYWFSNAENISVALEKEEERIRDSDAWVRVKLSMDYELRRTGDRRSKDQVLEMFFERTAGGWRLLRAER